MTYDLAIVGAGPAGLGLAIAARLRGLTVLVVEKAHGHIDKACGEGVMPVGLHELERLGVTTHLDATRTARIVGIRYINEDGRAAAAPLPSPGGLGIRRVALSAALLARAAEVGVVLLYDARTWSRDEPDRLWRSLDLEARFLVGADGLHSTLRGRLGPAHPAPTHRFGLRQHFAIAPWTDHVEVYFSANVEAYVTPVGANEVGVAFLWDKSSDAGSGGFAALLARFPQLARRLAGASASSPARGAGPLEQRVSRIVDQDFALVGDAAGYVDAITGEGISLALAATAVLADELARKRHGLMVEYRAAHRRAFASYARLARTLVAVAARPRLRRGVITVLSAWPGLFAWALRRALVH